MQKTQATRLFCALVLILLAVPAPGRSPAQPRAYQGYGSSTEGGLGGDVFHVTSLADSGSGSLREGITRRAGARTVVFDVAGTITLRSPLFVRTPLLTLKGSSAPAPGITIRQGVADSGLVLEGTRDVVVEGLRFLGAADAAPVGAGPSRAPLTIDGGGRPGGASQIVIDHVSVRSSFEHGLALRGTVSDVTISWSLFAFGVPDAQAPPLVGGRRISIHHNVFAKGGLPSSLAGAADLDVVNNVVYDWGASGETYGIRLGATHAAALGNVIANVLAPAAASPDGALVYGSVPGPDAEDGGPSGTSLPQGSTVSMSRLGRLWVSGNVLPAENLDQYSTQAGPVDVPVPARVTTSSAFDLAGQILPLVGTSPRDAFESALLEEVASALPAGPAISIADASVKEGDSGVAEAAFAVTLSAPSSRVATVRYSTADGTAAADADYEATSGVLTFAPGVTEMSVTVAVKGDTIPEGDEAFSVNLSDPRNATIARGQARGTILDDDAPTVSISAGDASVAESGRGTTNAVFTLTLSAPSRQRISVAYATADGTAVAGSDYVATAGTAAFEPGTTMVDVPVAVLGRTVAVDETFFLVLSDPAGASLARARGQGTLLSAHAPTPVAPANPGSPASATATPTSLPVDIVVRQLASAAVSGTTYHVANATCNHGTAACSDSNSGLSRSAPLCTVQAGLNKLAAGSADTLLIHSGTYVDDAELPNWANKGGASASSPITIQGAPGDAKSSIILRGTASQSNDHSNPATANTAVIRINGNGSSQRIQNIRVKDLTINPGNVHGIFVFNGSYVEVDNVDFLNWQGSPAGGNSAAAFGAVGSDHVTLKNSTMTNGGVQQAGATGVELTSGVSDVLIYNNVVHDFQGGCTHGSSSGNGKGRVLYAQNDFRNCQGTTDETATFQIYNDQDVMFYGNLVVVPSNGLDEVFSIRRTNLNQDSSSAHIIGNTIINNATGRVFAVRAWGQAPDAAVVRNNIFVGFDKNSADSIIRLESLLDCTGFDEDYNYVYGLPSLPLDNQSSCSASWGPHTTLTSSVPPGLDASYVPNSGAPVVDKGDPALGYPKGSTGPRDIGVFDFGAPGQFPLDFASMATTASSTPTFRWGGSPQGSDIVLHARNRPVTSQAAFRVQIDPKPTFDSMGVWTPLVDSGHISSSNTFWTPSATLPDGLYYARVTVSGTSDDQEWSDPYFRFTVSSGPGISVSNASATEGPGAVATFTVSLSRAGTQALTVAYATADGTALAGSDYVATSGTLTFQPGDMSKSVSVSIIDDSLYEDLETFFFNLSNPTNGGILSAQGTGSITDNDPPPSVSIGDVSQPEGNSGTSNMVFTATLSSVSGRLATVQYATADGTAKAPSDYTSRSGTLTFPPGTTTQTISVPIVGDTISEPDETFVVNLSAPSNATLGRAQGTGTILNDDVPGMLSFDATGYSASEGTTATIRVIRTGGSAGSATVDYATADGTAVSGSDYTASSGTLTFAAGVTSQVFTIAVLSDNLVEGQETVNLSLASPTGGASLTSPSAAILTIIDVPPGTDTSPPTGIGNRSPLDASTGAPLTPALTAATASDATGPVSYFFELYAGTSCAGTPAQTRAYNTSTTWTPTTLSAGATYAWRNKAEDAVSPPNQSAFGPCWTFTTTGGASDTTPPTGVGNISPANGATGASQTPTLTAATASDPTGPVSYFFELYAGTSCSGTPVQTRAYVASTTWLVPVTLTGGATYAWRNKAEDAASPPNESAFGPCWTFATSGGSADTTPPTGVGNVSPASGATGVATSPTLTAATASDPTAPVSYDFELYTGASCTGTPVQSRSYATPSAWAPLTLSAATTYAWRNKAEDAASPPNQSAFGPCWTFTTSGGADTTPPTGVGNQSPRDASTGVSLTPTLAAAPASDASTPVAYAFELYVGTSCTGTPAQSRWYTTASTWVPLTLAGTTTYAWRNKARDAASPPNESAFGACWSFTTTAGPADTTPPTGVGNLSPTSGTTGVTLAPTLTAAGATDSTGPASYYFELYAGTSCVGTPVQTRAYDPSRTWVPSALSGLTDYAWRNKARDAASPPNESAFGACWTFTTAPANDTSPPTGVGDVSPANGATGVAIAAALLAATASDATTPVAYAFELYAGTQCSGTPVQSRWYTTASIWAPATLSGGTTYAWRNKARDSVSPPNESAFGPCWTFTTAGSGPDTTPPTGVGNVSPANGATGSSPTPTLTAATATDATGPVSYYFELYSGASCSGTPAQTRAYATSTTWVPATLSAGSTYAWRNKAEDAVSPPNESAFGPCWTFTTASGTSDTTPPTGVGNVSPAGGSTGVSQTPTLTAATATDPTGPVSYFFELYSGAACSGTPAQTRAYGTSTTWAPATLSAGATYAWRNKAEDGASPPNESSFGPCWTFTTAVPADTSPPTGVGNVSPANGATGASLTPTLTAATATDPTGPVNYFFELYSGAACSGTPTQTRAYGTSTTWVPATLSAGTTFAWRNKARDSASPPNESAFGPCWTLATAGAADTTPPTGVGNVSPANGATGGSLTPTLTAATATDPTGPVSYFFELYAGTSCSGTPAQTRAYGTSTAWAPSALSAGVTYAWRNKAEDAASPPNESAFGPCWTFTTAAGAPSSGGGLLVYVRDVASGPVGSFVTLYGRGFSTSGTVTFGGVAATQVPVWTDSKIIVGIPPGAVTGDLVVTVGAASSSAGVFAVRSGRILYVDGVNGSDGNAGTQGAPWKTLAHASATVAAGDVVLIRGGVYSENNGAYGLKLTVSGTASQPIVFRGFPGETARIMVGGSSRSDSVRISGSYNVLAGVQVSDSGAQGVAVSGSHNVVFDCEIFNNHLSTTYGATGSGVNIVLGTQDNRVYANRIHHNGSVANQDHGLYIKGSTADIAWNDVGFNAAYGAQLYEGSGTTFTGVILRNNVFHDNRTSGIIVSKGASGASVFNNIFYGNTQAGIQVNYTPVSNLSVYNNTSYHNGTWEYDILTGSTVTLKNNIASATSSNVLRVGTAVSGFTSDFNLFGPSSVKISYRGTTYSSLSAYQSASGKDGSSRQGDPLLVNPASGNFLLRAASPALDHGTGSGAPLVDRFGVARPQGSAWDIGAHEGVGGP